MFAVGGATGVPEGDVRLRGGDRRGRAGGDRRVRDRREGGGVCGSRARRVGGGDLQTDRVALVDGCRRVGRAGLTWDVGAVAAVDVAALPLAAVGDRAAAKPGA